MTSSERPSPEPLLKKERPQPYRGGENSGNALEPSSALNYRAWGIPAVLSRGIPGKALRAFPEFFRNLTTLTLQTLLFWKKQGFFPKKARVFLFAEPLKSLEKEGKTQEKARKIGKTQEKARIGGSGCRGISSGKSQPYWGCGLIDAVAMSTLSFNR